MLTARNARTARLARIQASLRSDGARGLAILAASAADPDLASFLGDCHLGAAVFVVPAHGEPMLAYCTDMEREEAAATGWPIAGPVDLDLLDAANRWGRDSPEFFAALLEGALTRAGCELGRILLAGSPPVGLAVPSAFALARRGYSFASGQAAVRRARRNKTPDEVQEIQQVARVVEEAFRSVAQLLSASRPLHDGELWLGPERLRAGRLREEIQARFGAAGLEQPRGNIVAAGSDAAVPHSAGASDRVLREGETLIVDLFPRRRLFADVTRTFVVGDAAEAVIAAHALVCAVLEDAVSRAVPGASGPALQNEACAAFERAGWASLRSDPAARRGYVHGLGHGVGYELHELPGFRTGADPGNAGDTVLEAGDVITVEPGLYDPEAGWGIRVENLVEITASGPRRLTTLPTRLDPRQWSRTRGDI